MCLFTAYSGALSLKFPAGSRSLPLSASATWYSCILSRMRFACTIISSGSPTKRNAATQAMATPRFETHMYPGEKFVESAGTILFKLSTREICTLRAIKSDEYVLPKGRRNVGEARQVTAIRETMEETGIPCRLFPVNLMSRVCPAIQEADLPDEPRFFEQVCEPIALQTRLFGQDEIKLIWWFVAAVNEDEPVARHEDKFDVEFYRYDAALERLTFGDDREMVKKAIGLVKAVVE